MDNQKYNEQQEKLQSRYTELIKEYKAKPKGNGGLPEDDPLELALQEAETSLLENPPLTEVIDPDGKPTGIFKPRVKGLTMDQRLPPPKSVPLRRSGFGVIPQNQWSKWMNGENAVDGRRFVPDGMMLDQDAVGSCASEGMSGMIMKCRVYAGQTPVKLNPWFAYHTVSGGSDRGSSLQDNVAFAQEYGVCSQAVYGRSKGWRPTPSREAYEDGKKYRLLELYSASDWEEFGTALLLWGGVYFGYSGHAIWATKLIDSSRIEYCNSWGEDWSDGGFGTLSKSRIMWGYGAYAFRTVTEAQN